MMCLMYIIKQQEEEEEPLGDTSDENVGSFGKRHREPRDLYFPFGTGSTIFGAVRRAQNDGRLAGHRRASVWELLPAQHPPTLPFAMLRPQVIPTACFTPSERIHEIRAIGKLVLNDM